MNLKSLFTVILKIFGVYLFVYGLISLLYVFSSVVSLLNYADPVQLYLQILAQFIYVVFIIFVSRLAIIKTDWIISKFLKDEQLEADFTTFKVHRSVVLTISVIVIGGLTFIDEIPHLFRILYFGKLKSNLSIEDISLIIASIAKILIALFLILKNRLVVNWIEKLRKDTISVK
ncbi:MAG: hypothetical protein ACOYOT_08390 [Bacteroidales bacterium]